MGSHKTSSQETMVSFITGFSVLVLSPTLFAGIPFGGYSRAIPQRSVLETLIGNDQFSTLVAAVKIAFEDPAAVLASVAPLNTEVASVEGGAVKLAKTVSTSEGSANIVQENILASDGIIHAIDSII